MNNRLLLFLCFLAFRLAAQDLRINEIPLPPGQQEGGFLFTDRSGFVWLGGNNGLYRYQGTGYHAMFFPTGKKISAMFQDNQGAIWAGFEQGDLACLRSDSLLFLSEPNLNVRITGFAEDTLGQLWVSTYGQGIFVRTPNGIWVPFTKADGLNARDIYWLQSFNGLITAGTDQGVLLLRYRGGKKNIARLDRSAGLPDDIVTAGKNCGNHLLLGFYESSTASLNGDLLPGPSLSAPGGVSRILEAGGLTWILTNRGDVFYTEDRRHWLQVNFPAGRGEKVRHIASDPEGHLWVDAMNGLYRIDPLFQFRSRLPVQAVTCGGDGSVWFASDNRLFHLPAGTTEAREHGTFGNQILSLHRDQLGRLWIGTFGSGLCRYNPENMSSFWVREAEGLVNNNVLSIAESSQGIWAGTLGGVSFFARLNGDYAPPETVGGPGWKEGLYIYHINPAADGKVYLATDGQGVLCRDGQRTVSLQDPPNGEAAITSVMDREGTLWWLNTLGQLGRRKSNGEADYLTLPGSRQPSALATDRNGMIWVVREGGLDRLDPSASSWHSVNGAIGTDRLRPELNALATDTSGNWWIGCSEGLLLVRHGALPGHFRPATLLFDPELFFRPVKRLSFGPDENHLTFRYVGRWYSDPYRVRYKIMLESYDMEWSVTQDEEVTYPRLPPGTYTFRVIAGLNGEFHPDNEQHITVTIGRPYYATWWFWLLMALSAAGLITLYIRVRVNNIHQRQEREKEKVRAQYEALRSQVNPHFLFNSFNTLMGLIEQDAKQARSYLEKMSDFFRSMLQYRQTELIRLEEELGLVKSYLALQAGRYGENLRAEFRVAPEFMDSYVPPLTLQLLLENAIKHNIISRSKPLYIEVFTTNDRLVVRNNLQPKPKSEPSTGYGLSSIVQKYTYHVKDPVTAGEDGQFFTVSLPIIHTPPHEYSAD